MLDDTRPLISFVRPGIDQLWEERSPSISPTRKQWTVTALSGYFYGGKWKHSENIDDHRKSGKCWQTLSLKIDGSISGGPSLHRIINQALVDFWISLEAPIFTAYPLARVKDFTLKVSTIFLLAFESWWATMQLQTDVLPGAGTPSFLPRLISGHFDFPAGKYHPPPGQGRDLGASAEKLQKKRKREEAVALCIFNHVAILKEISITTLVVFEFLFSSPCQT